jgi:hypothetical protein
MTMTEIEDYLKNVATYDRARAARIQELLDKAEEDGMSPRDFLLARRALSIVKLRIGTPNEQFEPRTITITPEEDPEEH